MLLIDQEKSVSFKVRLETEFTGLKAYFQIFLFKRIKRDHKLYICFVENI